MNVKHKFDVSDYCSFITIFIIVCFLIHRDRRKRQSEEVHEEEETFISALIVNIASFTSWMTILAVTSEVYIHGVQFLYIILGVIAMPIFMVNIIVPTFYDLEISSIKDYLLVRFGSRQIITLYTICNVLRTVCLISITLYTSTLILYQAIGMNIYISAIFMLTIIIIHLFIGGLKTTFWINALQFVVTCGLLMLIIFKEIIEEGGLTSLLNDEQRISKINYVPSFRIDPYARHTFWSLFVGGCFWWIVINLDNQMIKRWTSIKNKSSIKTSMGLYSIAVTAFTCLCVYFGLFASLRRNCDEINTTHPFPVMMMKNFNEIPIVSGIFTAIIILTTIHYSTMELNIISTAVYEIFTKILSSKWKMREETGIIIMRLCVIILGISSICLIPLWKNVASILQIIVGIPSTFIGSAIGMLVIGTLLPWIGRRATFYGALIASFMMIYYAINAEVDFNEQQREAKCDSNSTLITFIDDIELKHYSYLYYLPATVVITCINAYICSFIFGFKDPLSIDPQLLAPFVRKFFTQSPMDRVEWNNYDTLFVDNENE